MDSASRKIARAAFIARKLVSAGMIQGGWKNYLSGTEISLGRGGSLGMGIGNVFEKGCFLEIQCGKLTLGDGNYFNRNVRISCLGAVEIGSDCLFGDGVHIYDHDHNMSNPDLPMAGQGFQLGTVRIGDGVWVGAKASILRGVSIGEGAVVGAGAVVTHDMPAFAVAAGVPARLIRKRGLKP